MTPAAEMRLPAAFDETDRRIVAATQAGLPLRPRPYHALAAQLGLDPAEVMDRIEGMRAAGIIRRIAAVPNHYALGYRANGMSVWDLPDERVADLGREVAALDFVSHCYRRPRRPPVWTYNLFAMIHGRGRDEVMEKAGRIAALLSPHCRASDLLFSTRILKKSGLRIAAEGTSPCSA